jgi:hypothetical protein
MEKGLQSQLKGTVNDARRFQMLTREDGVHIAQPSPQVPLHDVRVEGQWKRVKEEGQPPPAAPAIAPRR